MNEYTITYFLTAVGSDGKQATIVDRINADSRKSALEVVTETMNSTTFVVVGTIHDIIVRTDTVTHVVIKLSSDDKSGHFPAG